MEHLSFKKLSTISLFLLTAITLPQSMLLADAPVSNANFTNEINTHTSPNFITSYILLSFNGFDSHSDCEQLDHSGEMSGCDTIRIVCENHPQRRGACVIDRCEIELPEATCQNLGLPEGVYDPNNLEELIEAFPYRSYLDAMRACTLAHELQHSRQSPHTTSDCEREYEAYLAESTCLLRRRNENCYGYGTQMNPENCNALQIAQCLRQGASSFQECRCDNNIGATSDPVECPTECKERCSASISYCLAGLNLTPDQISQLQELECGKQETHYCSDVVVR